MEREDGFYWVRSSGRWQVEEWDQTAGWFWLCGSDIQASVDEEWATRIDEVGPRIERIEDVG